jgi:pyruvate kinase
MQKTNTTSTHQTIIIGTLGPACWDAPLLENLIDEGLIGAAQFNFSHGDHEQGTKILLGSSAYGYRQQAEECR